MLDKGIITLLILLVSNSAVFSQVANEQQRKKILELVEKEISVVKRSIHNAEEDQQLSLIRRLFNLYSEKMKVIRVGENESFLKSDGDDQKKYFSKSRKLYEESYQEALRILKNNPNFKDLGQFYYILALNDRDFFDGKKELGLYKKALSHTKDPKLINEIKASLADRYYNDKKFNKAITYYKDLIQNEKLKWWTKYSYNLAWCYLKKKKFSDAKNLMKQVAEKSLNKQYINFRKQALTDLALFFAFSRTRAEGTKWFKDNVDNSGFYIGKMANFYLGRDDYAQAQSLLEQSLKTAKGKDRIELLFKLLSLFEKSQEWNKHYALIQKLEKDKLVISDDIFKGQLTEAIKVASNFFQEEIKLKGKTAYLYRKSVELVKMLVKHLPEDRFETYYVWANIDIYFAEYQKGINNFLNALKVEKKNIENVTVPDVYEKLFGALENGCELIDNCSKQKKTIYADYLKNFPDGKFAKDVQIASIQLYIDNKEMTLASKEISAFYKKYSDDKSIVINSINQILDFYTKGNNVDQLEVWEKYVKDIGLEKDINVDGVKAVVSNIKFKQAVDTAKSEGNSTEALQRFINIFNAAGTTLAVKKDAALNASAIALSIGSLFQALDYSVKAIDLLTNVS